MHHSEKLGLVVTDRNTASVSVGDVRMSFGAHPAEVEGRIRFLHPLHNFAILSYNPADLPKEVLPRLLNTSCACAGVASCCGLPGLYAALSCHSNMLATLASALHLLVQARDAIVPITMNASPVKAGEHVSLIGEPDHTLL